MERINRNGVLENRIPDYKGKIIYFEGIPIHTDKSVWKFQTERGLKEIPVYSVWNYKNHKEIAKRIANGEIALLYMWGTYGVGKIINSPKWQKERESKVLSKYLKKGRPKDMPFVPFMYPEDMIDFWDIDRLHPAYRNLQWATAREELYEAGPVHIIAPAKKRNPNLDPSLIRFSDHSTSFYYMPNPAMERIIKKVRREVKHGVFAGGSANFHGETPAFTTEQLKRKMAEKPEWIEKVDFVLVCEITESYRIFRSQTQIRLPQADSECLCEIVRVGGRSPITWSERTGYPIKNAPDGVKFAPSTSPYTDEANAEIDRRIDMSSRSMRRFDKEAKEILNRV